MSNTEIIMHSIALILIVAGVGGRIYFRYKAQKALEELRRRRLQS